MSTPTTVTEGGYRVTSTSESADSMRASLATPKPAAEQTEAKSEKGGGTDLSEAAAALGKAGGEAAAAKRREAKGEGERAGSSDVGDTEAGGGDRGLAGDAPDKPLGKPRDDPRARMLEATRQAAEAKRERDAVRAEKDRLAAEIEQLRAGKAPTQEPAKAAEDPNKPKVEDFERYEDYLDARDSYREARVARQAEAGRHVSSFNDGLKTFYGRLGEAAKADPAFRERTMTFIGSLQPSPLVAPGERYGAFNLISDEIITSEHAPALAVYFVEHPEELQRLEALPTPVDVKVELRLISKGLSAAPTATAPEPKVSQANAPLRPVNGSPHTADAVPGESASYEEHKRHYMRKDREKLALR